MKQTITKSRKNKKSKGFNPNRDYLNEAMKDYIERGGKITKIVEVEDDYQNVTSFSDSGTFVDDFLMSQ